MGIYTDILKAKKSKVSKESYKEKTQNIYDEIDAVIKKADVPTPEVKDKVSVLNRLFGILSAGETGPAALELVRGKSLDEIIKTQAGASGKRITGQGVGEHATYEDVLAELGLGRNLGTKVAGLGLDIALDPTTYVGAGLIKGAGKVAGKVVGKTGKVAGKVISKVPAGAKAIENVADITQNVRKAFSPTARMAVHGTTPEMVEKALDIFSTGAKGTRYNENVLMKYMEDIVPKTVKEGGVDVGKRMSSAMELGEETSQVGAEMQKILKETLGEEQVAKLIEGGIENYVPHMYTDEARKFFDKTGIGYRQLPTSLKFSKQRTIEGTIESINKSFREMLEESGTKPFDLFESDIFKVFATRKQASIRALGMRRTVDKIAEVFGVNPAQNTKLRMIGSELGIMDGVKYVPLPDSKLKFFPDELLKADESLGNLLKTTEGGKVFIPKGIADELVNMNKVLINDENVRNILKLYDNALNAWKGSVTGIFPAFHGRNMLGGVFNNFIAGIKDPVRYIQAEKLARQSDEVITLGGKSYTYKELYEIMAKRGAVGQQGYIDVFGDIQKTIDVATEPGAKKAARTLLQDYPQKTMMGIETRLRGALFIDRLSKGDDIGDAVKQVWKYHFDYAPEAFTPFERNVMRRMIPFYTWTRRNIPLQLEQMAKQPGKYGAVGKTLRAAQGKDTDYLPEYMKQSFPIDLGNVGENRNIAYGGELPVENVNKLTVTGLLSQASPLIKTPIELATGKNLFMNAPLTDVNNAPKLIQNASPQVKKLATELIGYNEKTKKVDPVKWHILTSSAGRYIYTIDDLLNPERNLGAKLLRFLFGVKVKEVVPEQEKYYRAKETQKKMMDMLINQGAVYKGDYYGVPK